MKGCSDFCALCFFFDLTDGSVPNEALQIEHFQLILKHVVLH